MLGALEWRRRTGEGQFIDYAQLEGAAQLLAPEILEAASNGTELTCQGNDDPRMAPHGVYPVIGTDQWVAIACETDEQWRVLARLIQRGDLGHLSQEERLGRRRVLDTLLAEWTKVRTGEDVEEELQSAGVPAHRVLDAAGAVRDAQFLHRDHYAKVPHPVHGTSWAERSAIRLSRTPGSPKWAGPTLGQHLQQILVDILGYDDERISELITAGALE